jgi:hypothetical protein
MLLAGTGFIPMQSDIAGRLHSGSAAGQRGPVRIQSILEGIAPFSRCRGRLRGGFYPALVSRTRGNHP